MSCEVEYNIIGKNNAFFQTVHALLIQNTKGVMDLSTKQGSAMSCSAIHGYTIAIAS